MFEPGSKMTRAKGRTSREGESQTMSSGSNSDEHGLLGRLDERTEAISKRLERIEQSFQDYVTKDRYKPVELIAYGLVSGVVITVLGALLAQIIVK